VCFFPFLFVCLHVHAYAFHFNAHCGSALGPGASGLPYYCAPLVCVPDIIGGLTVWRHNKPKTKNDSELEIKFQCRLVHHVKTHENCFHGTFRLAILNPQPLQPAQSVPLLQEAAACKRQRQLFAPFFPPVVCLPGCCEVDLSYGCRISMPIQFRNDD